MIIDFLKRSAKVAGLCLFPCPKGRKFYTMRNDNKKYFANVTFYLPNGEGNKTWNVRVFARTQGGLMDEVLQVKKNYEAKHGKSTCKTWKWTGPDGFVRLMDQRKHQQKMWAQKQRVGS